MLFQPYRGLYSPQQRRCQNGLPCGCPSRLRRRVSATVSLHRSPCRKPACRSVHRRLHNLASRHSHRRHSRSAHRHRCQHHRCNRRACLPPSSRGSQNSRDRCSRTGHRCRYPRHRCIPRRCFPPMAARRRPHHHHHQRRRHHRNPHLRSPLRLPCPHIRVFATIVGVAFPAGGPDRGGLPHPVRLPGPTPVQASRPADRCVPFTGYSRSHHRLRRGPSRCCSFPSCRCCRCTPQALRHRSRWRRRRTGCH